MVEIADTYLGEMKSNTFSYLRPFEKPPILAGHQDQKVKYFFANFIERKQKKTELSEYEKIANDQLFMKKKSEVVYIDEDRDEKKHIRRKQNRIKNGKLFQLETKKSYGTMNSGSN